MSAYNCAHTPLRASCGNPYRMCKQMKHFVRENTRRDPNTPLEDSNSRKMLGMMQEAADWLRWDSCWTHLGCRKITWVWNKLWVNKVDSKEDLGERCMMLCQVHIKLCDEFIAKLWFGWRVIETRNFVWGQIVFRGVFAFCSRDFWFNGKKWVMNQSWKEHNEHH